MKKINGLWRLLRFELPFAAGICVVMGQILALGRFADLTLTSFGFLSVFLISASILVSNDYFDVETDRVNSPERPIPSGVVSQAEALIFSAALLAIGLLLSFLINAIPFLIAIILSAVGFLYNRYFKKYGLFGNLLVSISVGMTFIYGGATVGMPFNGLVIFFSLIAALIDLGEEIAADSVDAEGDLLIGSNSLAIKYGEAFAIRVSATIFMIIVLLSFIPFVLSWLPWVYAVPLGIMDLSICFSAWNLLRLKGKEKIKYIRILYMGSTFGLLVFLVMRLAG